MENAINFKTPFKGNKDWKLEFDGSFIDVRGHRVVVIGGGDTGTDCTATSIRQGCKSLVNLELMDKPPDSRDDIANAWPAYPRIFRTDYGQEEVKKRDGKDPRKYAVMTKEFIKDEAGNVTGVKIVSLKVERDANGKPSIAGRSPRCCVRCCVVCGVQWCAVVCSVCCAMCARGAVQCVLSGVHSVRCRVCTVSGVRCARCAVCGTEQPCACMRVRAGGVATVWGVGCGVRSSCTLSPRCAVSVVRCAVLCSAVSH
eukprot:2892207-Rhodomonas_salina.1